MSLNKWSKIVATFALLVGVFSVSVVYPMPVAADSPHLTADVYWLAAGFPPKPTVKVVGASSQLVANGNGVTVNLQTTGLEPGAAFTVWLTIFNNPGYCTNGTPPITQCGELDIEVPFGGDPRIQSSTVWATGHVVGQDGVGNFAAHLKFGDTKNALAGPGLIDLNDVEIHAVMRTHGQPIPGMVREQTSTLFGGCPPNDCINQQAAFYLVP